MVNHAEVAFELGKFTQDEADRSINKLRIRAFIATMVVAGIDAAFDPQRDPTVPPVLWEIRRERRIELFAEGKRFDDLRRWKKGSYLNKELLGCYIKKAELEDMRHTGANATTPFSGFALKLDRAGDAGRISINGTPTDGWKDGFYLYPIPKNQLTMNPDLKQNPGYEGL
jgi:starch-binding outer membrane protein, SusD/RagB family